MKRLVIPIAAGVLLAVSATTAGAQSAPPDLPQLRRDARASHIAVTRLQHQIERCYTPTVEEVMLLAEGASAIASRAAGAAWQVPGKQHVDMLNVQTFAEVDYWWLMQHGLEPALRCYVPPAE